MLIIGRLINGIGAGQLTAVFGVYASEVAPPQVRGAFGGMQMVSEILRISIKYAPMHGR